MPPAARKPSTERGARRQIRAALCCCCLAAATAAAVFLLLPLLKHPLLNPHPQPPLPNTSSSSSPETKQEKVAATSPSPPPPPPALDIARIARALDPDVMDNALPIQTANTSGLLLEGFKNPCWKVPGSDKPRCLPYFYLAGSFQAGQASLYEKLVAHPDVVHNEMTRWQFWGEEGKSMTEYVEKHGRSLPDLQEAPKKKLLLDGSASTFAFYWSAGLRAHQAFQKLMRPCWANCSETAKGKKPVQMKCMEEVCYPRCMEADKKLASDHGAHYDDLHLPLLLAAAYGGQVSSAHLPRIILLLRNPLDRLHSAYWNYAHYKGKYGGTAEGFLEYVKEQVGALRKCEGRSFSPRQCALYFEALGVEEEQLFFHADQLLRGMYALYLEVWLRHFPRDHVLIIKSEDYFKNNTDTLHKVYSFLGLDVPHGEKVLARIAAAGKHSSSTSGKPAMLPEAAALVQELYRPWNQKLAALTGDQAFAAWSS